MFSLPTDFIRVGDRDYLQGIHITDTMLRAVFEWSRPETAWLKIDTVKFIQKTLQNGRVCVFSDDEGGSNLGPCAVSLRGNDNNGHSFFAKFFPDEACPVSRHIVADALRISEIRNSHHFAGTFDVAWSDTNGYLKTLIEANKLAIKSSLPENGKNTIIEVTAVEKLYMPQVLRPFEGELTIRNLGVRSLASLQYVQNTLSWTDSDGKTPLVLTYSIRQI